MFEEFSNPPKGKGKEKDVGKRRAYCRVITSLGGSGLNIELFCEKVRTRHDSRNRFLVTAGHLLSRHRKHATTF